MYLINSYSFGGAAPTGLLLDLYPATVAYSVRKLRTAYTGACMRVRRSNDNAEQDIGFVSDELNTTSLLSFVGANDAFITTWYDQSGNGNNVTQTTAANQPRIVNGGVVDVVNSKPAVLGDGSNDTLRYIGLSLTNPITNFMVIDKIGTSGNFGLFDSGNALSGAYVLGTTGIKAYQNGASFSPIYANNNQSLISFKSATTGTDWDLYGNGTQVVNGGENIGTSIGDRVSLFDRTNNNLRCNMYMQEYIIYNADKSTDRVAIETDINNYYSIF